MENGFRTRLDKRQEHGIDAGKSQSQDLTCWATRHMAHNSQMHDLTSGTIFSFVSPANGHRSSYGIQKKHLTEALREHQLFEEGLLLDTMEKGVLFPIVHFTELAAEKRKPPLLFLNSYHPVGHDAKLQQGLYCKIKCFSPDVMTSAITSANPNKCPSFKALIFMGFKTLDDTFSEVLEDNWKDWTGARLVYLNLSDEFGLSKMSFYRRVSPKDIDVFMYIMTVECEAVHSGNTMKLLDFVQRLRVERMIGYLSVYRVFQKPSTAEVVNGLLSEDTRDDDETSI